jgi:hypothetical protein
MQLAHSRHAVNRSADQQAEATAAAATAAGSAAVAATGSAAAWHAKRARMIRLCLHSFRTLRGALKHDQTAAVNTPVKSRLRDGGRSSRAQAPDGRLNGELSMGRVLQRVPRLQSRFEPWNRLSKIADFPVVRVAARSRVFDRKPGSSRSVPSELRQRQMF